LNSIKIFLPILIALSILTTNCSSSNTNSKGTDDVSVIVEQTLQALTASAPVGIPVSSNNISIVIPNGLATNGIFETVPAATEEIGGPWGVAPEYTLIQLENYVGRNEPSYLSASIRVYPLQAYAESNSWAEGSINRLRTILASPNMVLTNEILPAIPFNGAAAQQYAAQPALLNITNGTGVRMVSQYAQFPAPITKDNSYYHFEGITNDGQYLIAAVFPLTLPLQSTSDNPSADGITFPDYGTAAPSDFETYYQAVTDKLTAAPNDSFQPNLDLLDALIRSIKITQ